MAFTYNEALATDRDKVRFNIQDTVSGSGPLPAGNNFADAELDGLLTIEGTWQKATAAAFETLQAAWGSLSDITVGPRKESLSQRATQFAWLAKKWRSQYGYTGVGGCVAVGIVRKDGYSTDVASDAVEESGGEYESDFYYVRPT